MNAPPRLLLAAAHKSSGKTVITAGLAAALRASGQQVQPFKKGPDYIDPMWLGLAAGRPCYNLDFNTMGRAELLGLLARRTPEGALALIEANKGLYDGLDPEGADSNAELAKLMRAPVVLVIDTTGMTRGIAPLLLGYRRFDAAVDIAGVILNRTGGARHEAKLRAAVELYCDLPVLGAVRRNRALEIGERHLGLTTPAESGERAAHLDEIGRILADSLDVARLMQIARAAPELAVPPCPAPAMTATGQPVRIAIARDAAFGFYYPDDLEAFARAGAELVPFDTLSDRVLPPAEGLFIGGGFPETHAEALAANADLRAAIREAIANGMPAYAECGGLMYLCRAIGWDGKRWPMVGAIAAEAVMHARPQGRGYTAFRTRPGQPWGVENAEARAHEFHYASLEGLPADTRFARDMLRGHGVDGRHDGIVVGNLLAGFCHLRHTDGCPWVDRFVAHVRRCRK
ncbi:MAG: cobyrinate a,c-diamide synthase [Alphaproteobacteria bacterium]|nr:MAG: cobyrinate a,c-diamide synthase [Alphaproteobacteria bacterium]